MNELALCLQKEIGEAHARTCDLSHRVEQLMAEQLESMRTTGILIGKAKQDLSDREFTMLRETIGLDLQTIGNYLSFANKHKAPVTDLRQSLDAMKSVFQAAGLLECHPGKAGRPLAIKFWATATGLVKSFTLEWHKFIAGGRELSEEEKDQLLGLLTPILQIARSLQ